MPRIYTSTNDPLDFCAKCFPDFTKAEIRYGHLGSGPDFRGNCFDYNSFHPPYDTTDYLCEKCGKQLDELDD